MAGIVAEAADQRMVHLVSQEGESFDVQLGVAKMSELVKTMIDGMFIGIVFYRFEICLYIILLTI